MRAWFAGMVATPGREAAVWAMLGVAGLLFGAAGIVLATSGGSSVPASVVADVTPTATRTATATPSPTRVPSATPTPEAAPSATPTAAAQQPAVANPQPASANPPAPTATTAPEPTPEPEPPAAAQGYCNTISSTAPPTRVFGLLTIGGEPAPAGTSVSLTFDGVVGPSGVTSAAGGYRLDFNAGGGDCANRVGAAVGVVVNGQAFATGQTVGGGEPFIQHDIAAP